MTRLIKSVLLLGLLSCGGLLLWSYAHRHPEDMPWTRLDLTQPVGLFTGRKLAALADEPAQCRSLLAGAGVRFTPLPGRSDGPDCGYRTAVRPLAGQALSIGYRPADLGVSCPVAAGLALWEWHVVQPAALRHFRVQVASIDHFGSYSCRRMYRRSEGRWSEHAGANAVDIAGFRLTDGRRVTIAADWRGSGPKAAFLDEVRDGACRLFATTLSPDYNAAHRDHLHFDQAARGAIGGRLCR